MGGYFFQRRPEWRVVVILILASVSGWRKNPDTGTQSKVPGDELPIQELLAEWISMPDRPSP
jgi:hypothetical protein